MDINYDGVLKSPKPQQLFRSDEIKQIQDSMNSLQRSSESALSGLMTFEEAFRKLSSNIPGSEMSSSPESFLFNQPVRNIRRRVIRNWNIEIHGAPVGPDGKLTDYARREIFETLKREQPELTRANERELLDSLNKI